MCWDSSTRCFSNTVRTFIRNFTETKNAQKKAQDYYAERACHAPNDEQHSENFRVLLNSFPKSSPAVPTPSIFPFIDFVHSTPSFAPYPVLRSEPLVPRYALLSQATRSDPNSREDTGVRGLRLTFMVLTCD